MGGFGYPVQLGCPSSSIAAGSRLVPCCSRLLASHMNASQAASTSANALTSRRSEPTRLRVERGSPDESCLSGVTIRSRSARDMPEPGTNLEQEVDPSHTDTRDCHRSTRNPEFEPLTRRELEMSAR